jgi:hypothetical protein
LEKEGDIVLEYILILSLSLSLSLVSFLKQEQMNLAEFQINTMAILRGK